MRSCEKELRARSCEKETRTESCAEDWVRGNSVSLDSSCSIMSSESAEISREIVFVRSGLTAAAFHIPVTYC